MAGPFKCFPFKTLTLGCKNRDKGDLPAEEGNPFRYEGFIVQGIAFIHLGDHTFTGQSASMIFRKRALRKFMDWQRQPFIDLGPSIIIIKSTQ